MNISRRRGRYWQLAIVMVMEDMQSDISTRTDAYQQHKREECAPTLLQLTLKNTPFMLLLLQIEAISRAILFD
jgi:vacuolar-type H+-ATPase subunit F/Vma7